MWPSLPKDDVIEYVKNLKAEGNKIILWTCREGERLDEAVAWCEERGLTFDYINENTQENIDKYGSDSRKVLGKYIDLDAINDVGGRRDG